MDVITAFLYRFLHEKIYIMQPTTCKDGTNQVCFLKKVLYDLKQTVQVWYQTLLDFFWKLNFHRTEADHGLFVPADNSILIAIYLDDLLIFDNDFDSRIDNFMQNFQDRFWMTDLGYVSYYFG